MSSLSDNDVPILCAECGTEDEISSNKKESTSCEQKNDDAVDVGVSSELLNDTSISNDNIAADNISTCANCGKEGNDINNTCNKCKSVKYCNAACKKKHRSKHKKECERRVAELHDEKLFKQPPPLHGDCPICFLRMPTLLDTGSRYKTCCGKDICSGCIHAVRERDGNIGLCPFCRIPTSTSDKEDTDRLRKRVELGDAMAIYTLGGDYARGVMGFKQNYNKALELLHRAGELGSVEAYYNIGTFHFNGIGVEIDEKKAKHYYELAAMKGCAAARYALGILEQREGNMDRAVKHWMIAAQGGKANSLNMIQQLYTNGDATKDDYTAALQGYQEYLIEIKSAGRDEAAAFSDEFKYY